MYDVDPLLVAFLGRPAMPVQDHQRLGIGHRQRAQQDRLHEAVDRSIGPDAERQQQDRQGTECLVGHHGAKAIADILAKLR